MMLRLRRYFVAGLLIWLPLVATYWVMMFSIRLIDRSLLLLPIRYRPETLIGFEIPGLGVILTIMAVIITGFLAASFFGRGMVSAWESILARIPLVRSIYGAVKQITASLFSDASNSFREVVLVEYPRREMWMLAFVTGETPKKIEGVIGEPLVNIYVPTTPNPTSGYYIMVPARDIRRLDITVETGLKMILSAGVVNPIDGPNAKADSDKKAEEASKDSKTK